MHPYRDLPTSAFWRKAVAQPAMEDVDPVVRTPFLISPGDRIATAGSCFAQHIARHLRDAGFTFLVTESAHPITPPDAAEAHGYGLFTARYGNIYTSRQLLQLFHRAYGTFTPDDDVWMEADERLTDPFRPQIQPDRFLTMEEFRADRAHHFARVREAFDTLDVFVFTLGLTECWRARSDGAVYPLCPGVAGGRFDPARHEFINLSAADVTVDLLAFFDLLRQVNPTARMVLTVSPVPLIATMADQHVLVATSYSKAVLRVAADQAAAARDEITYFPSYEIITGPHARGTYFADDRRSVTEAGVSHVMRVFMRHFTAAEVAPSTPPPAGQDAHTRRMEQLVRVVCDEEALDQGVTEPASPR